MNLIIYELYGLVPNFFRDPLSLKQITAREFLFTSTLLLIQLIGKISTFRNYTVQGLPAIDNLFHMHRTLRPV
jgi:hypothetical protein